MISPPLHPTTPDDATVSSDGAALLQRPHPPHSAGLHRDMEVLRELASEECLSRGGLGVVRIAERLGREKSQVSRALRALEAEGLVERDPRTRAYQLGWGLYTLAARGVETRLLRAASAHLCRLADEQRADIRLCVLIAGQVLTLISVPPNVAFRSDTPIETPCGPVLALDWSAGALGDLIPAGTSDDGYRLAYDNLLAGTTQARGDGYVHDPGTTGEPARYAAPVRDFRGIVLAAMELTARPGDRPAPNGDPPEQALLRAASALSAELGFER